MKTTLNKIYAKRPCGSGWEKLLNSLGKIKPDDEDLELSYILESNGIRDAIWALRCFNYLDYCLFLADVAEGVLDIYEKKHNNPAPRNAINAIRLFKEGKITKSELKNTAYAAASDAAASDVDAADAAADAAYADAAADAAYADAAYAADARLKEYQKQAIDLLKVLGRSRAGRPKGSRNFIKKEENIKVLVPKSLIGKVKEFINNLLNNEKVN